MSKDQWISFRVAEETYVHPIDNIKEIIPYENPVPVPGAPESTEGILNVRGNVITILSGRSLFDEKEVQGEEDWRIVILELPSDQVGISVDAVGNIVSFSDEEAEWLGKDTQHQLVKGTVQRNGQLYILTDFSSIDQTSH